MRKKISYCIKIKTSTITYIWASHASLFHKTIFIEIIEAHLQQILFSTSNIKLKTINVNSPIKNAVIFQYLLL